MRRFLLEGRFLLTMVTVGERMAWARKASGLSQRALCRLSCRSLRHVALIERGEFKEPRASTLTPIADALGVPLPWLMFGQGDKPEAKQIRAHVKELLSRPRELQPAGDAQPKRAAGA